MLAAFFVVKNLPMGDILALASLFGYDKGTGNREQFREVMFMRHVYIRGIMGLIWMAAAIVTGISGNFEMALFYVVLGGVFLYNAYGVWKKENDKGGK